MTAFSSISGSIKSVLQELFITCIYFITSTYVPVRLLCCHASTYIIYIACIHLYNYAEQTAVIGFTLSDDDASVHYITLAVYR